MMLAFTRLDSIVARRPVAAALLAALFVYRLCFGLCSEFWFIDERQIYLIGLKFYTTGAWPFFGPDLVLKGVEQVHQIPGALQGLLVGLPFFVAPIPEAPFVLLNALSFAALVLLAWYGSHRVPSVPRWVAYGLALTLPWTLHYSTHVVNPSYVLPGAILFWIATTEAVVFPDQPLLPPLLTDYCLGFGLVWVMQLHMSWTLLVPFAAFSWLTRARRGNGLAALGGIALGCVTIGSLLLPTVLTYGLKASGNAAIALRFKPTNARDFAAIAARILSFASFEMPRFIGSNYVQRKAWVLGDLRLAPFAILAVAVGLAQPLAMTALWFRREGPAPGWPRMKALAVMTIVLTCASFLFTVREPWALTFYLTMPVVFLYSLFCYGFFLRGERWLAFAALVLVSGLVTNTALALRNSADRSMYLARERPAAAIAMRDYRLLGTRRAGTFY